MNGNDASQDLRQLTSQNLKTASCWEGEETQREEFLKGKFLTPVFQYKGTGQFVMNIFTWVSKKPRGARLLQKWAECIVVLELNNNKQKKKFESLYSSAVQHIKMKTWKHHDKHCIGNNTVLKTTKKVTDLMICHSFVGMSSFWGNVKLMRVHRIFEHMSHF